ncbi:ATP-binding cassette sub-family A member 2-like, partial [Notothenia coriiceps]|uniref:ATP-binding cassette sub-family A member 2-like n=1 Tax=Notothenia coriiceps TaxID=8208 RepID=A0A6I9NM28_9TELE
YISSCISLFSFLLTSPSVSVTQLLERISEVLEQNHLFMSDRPGLCQELESLQQHLESLSSSPLPPDSSLNSSQGFTLASVLVNPSGFQQFLVRNLSLSSSTASLLLNTPVSLPEVISVTLP